METLTNKSPEGGGRQIWDMIMTAKRGYECTHQNRTPEGNTEKTNLTNTLNTPNKMNHNPSLQNRTPINEQDKETRTTEKTRRNQGTRHSPPRKSCTDTTRPFTINRQIDTSSDLTKKTNHRTVII